MTKTGAGVETRQIDKTENLEITGKALPLKLKTKEQKHTLEEKKPIQPRVLGKLDIHLRKIKLESYFSSCTKISSHRIKDLNLKPETQSSRQKYRE